ncbi:ABC transporter substrate-binding protein [Alsobacter sp. SYSU M60028]|uniref:ABC transporter substrate-binding protein n=1 Tax=Alsobacter ponti TaxID=2962936 RepID=A0ABT1L921_9HYPH|nr:ABC transporter substrate-binding protein [Alsobacter ponti]MCP8937979.1 ABC transporter substrate-binding protein [Alsobacter ponti]
MIAGRRTFMMAALGAVGLAAIAAGPVAAQQKLAVGAYPSNPPWEFKNEKGEFEGFEIEVVKEVAKRIGVQTEIADMGFQALFAATSSGRIDVAVSSITITPERLKSQSFTQAYYDADLGMAAKKASGPKTLAELKGKTVGVLSTSTGDKWSKENQAKYGIAKINGYNAQNEMLLDLANGRVDAAISDVPGMEYSFLKMKDLAVAERIKTGEQYALMMRKGHPLLEKANDAITAMKKDGTLAAIHKKWFGTDAPADSSTAQVRPMPKE